MEFGYQSEVESENEDQENPTESNQLQFVSILKKYSVLLDKSQIPSVKDAKKKALSCMLKDLQSNLLLTMTEQQLLKKINNMKTQIKKKLDLKATGNKKIILSAWEKAFCELLRPETNPVYAKIPGAICVGVRAAHNDVLVPEIPHHSSTLAAQEISKKRTNPNIPQPPEAAKKKKSAADILDLNETEETKLLSTMQLQRLVYLRQLKLIDAKLEYANKNKAHDLD